MNSKSILFSELFLVVLIASYVGVKVAEGANTTITISANPSSLSIRRSNGTMDNSTTTGTPSVTSSASPTSMNKTADEEDDCTDDDEPVAEPEGNGNGTRQGKELDLTDKEKYSHENGTAHTSGARKFTSSLFAFGLISFALNIAY